MKFRNRWYIALIVLLVAIVFGACLWFFEEHDTGEKVNENIPIAMALDDGYTYPTLVAITSMMESKTSNSMYDYYIMHPGEFSEESKVKLKSLEKKYNDCKINLIDMGQEYKDANDKGHITTPTYYRLSLPKILPNIDKLIWIDGDTITRGDLNEMYNLDMKGLYCRGFLDSTVDATKSFGVNNDHCICAGVMLLNLAELRKDDMFNKFKNFIEENNDKLVQHDQTVINVLCADKMGILPAKFGVFNTYRTADDISKFQSSLTAKNKYSIKELTNAVNNPVILHCVDKPWKSYDVFRYDWWVKWAKKTDYYPEIQEKYKGIL